MNQILNSAFRSIRSLGEKKTGTHALTGISEQRSSLAASLLLSERKGASLIITPSPGRAERLGEDFAFFAKKRVYVFPEDESRFLRFEAKSHQYLEMRLAAMTALARNEDCVVIASAAAALKYLPKKERFMRDVLTFEVGGEMDLDGLKDQLVALGYERVSGTVEAKGQFSFRGDILDIYPTNQLHPRRIEFFDTEVDSIRIFDPETQRSEAQLERAEIYPAVIALLDSDAGESALPMEKDAMNPQMLEKYLPLLTNETSFLWEYLPSHAPVVIEDPLRAEETLEAEHKDYADGFRVRLEKGEAKPEEFACYASPEAFQAIYQYPEKQTAPLYLLMPLPRTLLAPSGETRSLDTLTELVSKQPPVYNGKMDFLATDLKRFLKQKFTVILALSTAEREENIRSFLDVSQIPYTSQIDDEAWNSMPEEAQKKTRIGKPGVVTLATGVLSQGAEFPAEKWLLLSDADIFSNVKYATHRKHKETKHGKPIQAFTDLAKGDYVVHEVHGIAKFLGVEPLEVDGVRKDYLKLAYAGEDYLYVPVEQMDVVQKYIGGGDNAPRISKLGGNEWEKTKQRAKAAIEDMTQELLELSAARQLEKGYAFSPDTVWQREFEDKFPYEETPDQLRAVREIKKDMERPVVMDRLLCGDVGYGKTEVAARAIFKCIADGKQAAVLVPTTILANQHYNTFLKRFEGFPFAVDMLSRFRSEQEQSKTLKKLAKGEVDVLVGTHRILSRDVHFKDLGLLVVDEEQRFGVQHKEAIKMLRKNVDVLTLSATPIPRTLHMSLVGIRDMSLIEEPPEERYPVQTYVLEQDESLLREAIRREIDRKGQVYIVFNRVKGIQKVAHDIQELVPEANVGFAHGQMNETELEQIMMDFVDAKFNVLVSTTIIESGLDIPNVNTMIVLDADRFGLSQLYQLRGRVGRSNRLAYCYLMFQRDKSLSEIAEKRLRAIREFTEFGSGFRIAMRDLEIRGAGNLLGAEQSGHMMTIGYELYCKLVDDAIRKLQGNTLTAEEQPETQEVQIELNLAAYIPEYYIEDEISRLGAYKHIAEIRREEEKEDFLDELIDRYGDPPEEVLTLLEIARLKAVAEEVGCIHIHKNRTHLLFEFAANSLLTPEKILALIDIYNMKMKVFAGLRPSIGIALDPGMDLLKSARDVLDKVAEKEF